ncbi:MAG: carbohydrate ABC transporter substrate-binding protein [Clostridia bacterium]|nr:carbohydrate ABC transporter substrate-binding protein [Clostridia bacterium]
MKSQRIFSLLLVLTLPLTLLSGCAKTEPETPSEPPKLEEGVAAQSAEDFALIDGELWVIEDGEAHKAGERLPEEENPPSTPPETEERTPDAERVPEGFQAAFIASNGSEGTEPVLCSQDGVILWDGEVFRLNVPGDDPEITSFAVAGDTAVAAYTAAKDDGGPGNRLVYLNRASGDCISGDPLAAGRARVLPCDGEHVWIMNQPTDFTCYFYRTDVRSMQSDLPIRWEDYIVCAGWDPSSETLYAVASRGGRISEDGRSILDEKFVLRVWDFREGEGAVLPFEPEGGKPPEDMSAAGGQLIVRYADGTVSVMNAPGVRTDGETDDGRTVTLIVIPAVDPRAGSFSEGIGEALVTHFAAEGIRIRLKRLTEEQINVKLLAGDDDFDLFQAEGRRFFGDKGFWSPLEDYPVIRAEAEKMLPDAYRLCCYDGHMFGVPYQQTSASMWRVVNEKAAAKMGLTDADFDAPGISDGTWTLDDYYDLAVLAKKKGCAASRGMMLSLTGWGNRYLDPTSGKVLDPDGVQLKRLLETEKKMLDEGLFWKNSGLDEDDLLFTSYQSKDLFGADNELNAGARLAFIPTFDGERNYSAVISYFVLNRQSKNKELAAEVLACVLDPERREKVCLIDDYSFPLYRQEEEKMKTDAARRNWDLYLDALRHVRLQPAFYDEWMVYASAEEEKYLNDEQDLDNTVKRILDRAKMVLEG